MTRRPCCCCGPLLILMRRCCLQKDWLRTKTQPPTSSSSACPCPCPCLCVVVVVVLSAKCGPSIKEATAGKVARIGFAACDEDDPLLLSSVGSQHPACPRCPYSHIMHRQYVLLFLLVRLVVALLGHALRVHLRWVKFLTWDEHHILRPSPPHARLTQPTPPFIHRKAEFGLGRIQRYHVHLPR